MGKGGGDGMPRERTCIASWGFWRIGIQSPTTCGVSNVPLSYTPHQALDKHQPLFFCFFWGPLFFTMYIHTWSCTFFIFLFFRTGSLGGFFFFIIIIEGRQLCILSRSHTWHNLGDDEPLHKKRLFSVPAWRIWQGTNHYRDSSSTPKLYF